MIKKTRKTDNIEMPRKVAQGALVVKLAQRRPCPVSTAAFPS